jgi:signal peptidase complex subunit 3
VIVWDRILPASPSTGHAAADLRISNEHVKYALAAQGDELRGANVTLRLLWDHMPITGRLYTGGARDLGTSGPSTWTAASGKSKAAATGASTFTLPKRYKN